MVIGLLVGKGCISSMLELVLLPFTVSTHAGTDLPSMLAQWITPSPAVSMNSIKQANCTVDLNFTNCEESALRTYVFFLFWF